MSEHHIEYDNQMIVFEVERKNVKNVNLNIKPDMTVKVSANENVPLEFIEDLVRKKAPWVLKHVKGFAKVQPERKSEREYVSGESYKYLGKQYRLRVKQVDEKSIEGVKYLRGFIHLYVQNPNDLNKKKRLIQEWYRERANKIFLESLEKIYPKIQKYGVEKPTLQVRSMKARWGSALIDSSSIQINSELIKAPKPCIDYVILHELIHFKYNDHSKKFYEMLYALMPDWESRKEILDEDVVKEL
ncbi:hydrolase [Paraliobacillus quinghaiensis]|uniref:Hydrolase n=1 Tax=Paraliobacillus quinghaiensis TaxID=470815 RepID=A0A917WU56_9BACI|nr:SprT family zinc-dependent metalloprotease [Paraliobacillus quinghaiensis]GGM28192.1 hydrolase [Paraliobacillus quinghaiensis]